MSCIVQIISKIKIGGGDEERSQNIFKKNFLKALGCFYVYEKHKELCVRPILFEKEMFIGLLA